MQDEKYCWFLLKDAPAHKKEEKRALPKTALSSLAQYYLSCIGQDDEGGVSAFAESKYGGLDYAELPNLPLSASDSLFESSDAQRLLGKMRKDRSRFGDVSRLPLITQGNKIKEKQLERIYPRANPFVSC